MGVKIKIKPNYGTHLPILIKLLSITDGPVLELGVGICSTPFLHWACAAHKRPLVSFESDLDYYKLFAPFQNDYHRVEYVQDWASTPIEQECDIAFIDHAPADRRRVDALRLADCARFIVLHDTYWKLDKHYKYTEIFPLFKYRKDFDEWRPTDTTILSNFEDVTELEL